MFELTRGWTRLALVGLGLAACQGEATPQPTGLAPRGLVHPGLGATVPLPGTIWYIEDGDQLASLSDGKRTAIANRIRRVTHRLPDGRLVAIASRGDEQQLVLVGVDRALVELAPPAARLDDPAVDPAGAWVIYARDDGQLVRIELATRETRVLRPGVAPVALGSHAIVFGSTIDGNPELYRSDPQGDGVVRLTDHPGADRAAVPSPDGTSIAFSSDRDGSPKLFVMSAAGGTATRLTRRAELVIHETRPAWSPDGKLVAYVLERGPRHHVWVREIASGSETDLTPEGMRDDDPCFSPDGRWVAVSRTRGHDVDLWALPAAVGDAARVTTARTVDQRPYWR